MYFFEKYNKKFYLKATFNIFFKWSIPCFVFEETARISCPKNVCSAFWIDFASSFFEILSAFDKTTITGSSISKIYLYISISDCCAQSFASTSITTAQIYSLLSSKYHEIRASKSSFICFPIFAKPYPGKSVK